MSKNCFNFKVKIIVCHTTSQKWLDTAALYNWATLIFGGKIRNPYFCHIFLIRGGEKKRIKGNHWLGQGYKLA